MTDDGRPYAPERYKEIVRERYEISKRINTSYNDLAHVTPTERNYLMQFILEDIEHENKIIEQANSKIKA